jgi:maltooligosyltrehalose trehalohydrolase
MVKRAHPMPFGAEFSRDEGTRFSLWAPGASLGGVELILYKGLNEWKFPMKEGPIGWHQCIVGEKAEEGDLYAFSLNGRIRVPDPASRFQPEDVHGPSQIVDPFSFEWEDSHWKGRPWEEAVIYELHVGAFTEEGTFRGVEKKLDYLLELGVTAIELMPVSDFPGKRNWGYDGVLPFAPDNSYGRPEDLKRLVQAAHKKGIMVILDVVYNHFGPDGNYLYVYAKDAFFTSRHQTPWGDAINFDGKLSKYVRSFFIHNALYWLEEYHMDGLRLDAVHAIKDSSRPDILEELAEKVMKGPGKERHIHLVLENDDNKTKYLKRDEKKRPIWYVAQWNEDMHHALHCLLTGEKDGYYADYSEKPLYHLERCLTEGFSYQGEISSYRGGRPRGEPSFHLPPTAFVSFLQNHDQVGNRAFGERIHSLARDEAIRAAASIYLLAPSIPLIFMGEEQGSQQPFLFFCDFSGELSRKVRDGRRREFSRFARFKEKKEREKIPNPNNYDTFKVSVLDWNEINRKWLSFYKELLALRKKEIIPRILRQAPNSLSGNAGHHKQVGAVLKSAPTTISVKWILGDGSFLFLYAHMSPREVGARHAVPLLEYPNLFRLIYESKEGAWEGFIQGRLSPWVVLWFLKEDV